MLITITLAFLFGLLLGVAGTLFLLVMTDDNERV